MAGPSVIRVMFTDGVYLNGTVKQGIALAPKALEGSPPATLLGLTTVERIEATGPGLMIEMKGRWFLIPWQRVSTCEVENPFGGLKNPISGETVKSRTHADLLGDDEAALERATRPEVKPTQGGRR